MAKRTQGEISRRSEGKWLVRWYVGTDANGKRRYSSKTVRGTKRDAQKFLNTVLRNRDLGQHVEPSRTTLNEFLDEWLKTAAKQKLAPRTFDDYGKLLDLYVRPTLGKLRLDSIRPLDVQGLIGDLEGRGLSAKTVRLAIGVLGSALKQAVRWGMLASNPATLVDLPRQTRREMLALSKEEVAHFRKAAEGNRHAALFDFLLGTGCRPGEGLALRWQDLDLQAGTATILRALTKANGKLVFGPPKTAGSRRAIPLPPSLVVVLREHRKRQAEHAMKLGPAYDRAGDLVFANEAGTPLDLRNVVKRHFKPILKAAGLPAELRLYDLRHSHATALLAAGVHPKVAAERLGHASTRMTMDVYSHVLPGMQEEATRRIEESLFSG